MEGRTPASEVEGELEALRRRVAELEGRDTRIAELEERLDFAERRLAQREPSRLPESGQ